MLKPKEFGFKAGVTDSFASRFKDLSGETFSNFFVELIALKLAVGWEKQQLLLQDICGD